MQTLLGQYAAREISKITRTPITVKAVDIRGLRSFTLKGLYIEDYKKDTLIYAEKLNVRLDSFNLDSSRFYIGKININKMFFNLQEDKKAVLNIEHFIDSLTKGPSNSKSKAIDLRFKDISIKNSRFVYEVEGYKEVDYEINWEHILVDDLNVEVENLYFKNGAAYFNGRSISLRERTGFYLERLSGQAALGPGFLDVKKLLVKTPYSKLNLSQLAYRWVPGRRDWSNFLTKMDQKYVIEDSYASFRDIAHFNGKLAGIREVVRGRGTAYSTISNLQAKDLEIYIGDNSVIKGNFSSSGLPDIFNAKYKVDFKKLDIDINDIENIYIPWEDDKKYVFWDKLKNLGIISYFGSFDGTFSDFSCSGMFNTDAGSIVANTKIIPDKRSKRLNINGYVRFLDFNLGLLLDNPKVGNIKFESNLDGSFDEKAGFKGSVDGTVSDVEILNYVYHNLSMSGDIDNKNFMGQLNLRDKNITLDFIGGIDFNDRFPVANFSSTIRNARLKNLNLTDKDIDLSLDLKADFRGNLLADFDGSVLISNTFCSTLRDTIHLDNFSLYTGYFNKTRSLTLKSDIATFSLKGDYDFYSILDDFKEEVYKKIPNYKPSNYILRKGSSNKFLFSLHLNKTNELLKIFYPSLKEIDGTEVYWNHYYTDNTIDISINSPLILYKNISFSDLSMHIKSDHEKIQSESSVSALSYGHSYNIYNLKNKLYTSDNEIQSSLSWNNWDASTYSGFLSAKAKVSKTNTNKSKTDIYFDEGNLIVSDSLWTSMPANLSIVGNSYSLNGFKFYKKDHFISIDGTISESPKDTLSIAFSKCDVDKITDLFNFPIVDIKGVLNGKVDISDVYNKPKAIADISIKNIVHNNEKFGDVNLKTQWNDKSKRILLDAYSERNKKKQISVNGWYSPEDDKINVFAVVDSLQLSYGKSYLSDVFKELNGYLQANIEFSNTLNKPKYKGYIKADQVSFVLKSNNCRYFANDSISLSTKNMIFQNFIIKDDEGNLASIIGDIQIDNHLQFDISVLMNKLKLLNTSISDNSSFYGKAYLTGSTQIFGQSSDLKVDVDIKTEKGTDLAFALSKGSTSASSDFISFIDSDNLKLSSKKDRYLLNVSKTEKDYSNINLNCNLELTEDVNTQIIFNEKLGDAIKANGFGNLKIQLSKEGNLDLYGNYNIVKGSYLFTLQNVAVSKFILAKGGSIKWSGSPYSAVIDLNAIYKVRTSLYNLMPDNKDPNISLYQKVPVDCIINLKDNILTPKIEFKIDFPSLNHQNRTYVKSLFRSQDDINKQFLYLLVLNRFNTPEYVVVEQDAKSNASVGITTASELLSNQLSTWISQISDDFDFGFKYRPKDDISSDEIELALSTQFFSDRVTLNVNGNIDTGNNEKAVTNNNAIIGDFDLEWKLSRDGNFKFKAYSKTNNQVSYKSSKTTQGVGLQYQEDFNSFEELISKYFNAIFRRKDE